MEDMKTFMVACKTYFNFKPGQSLMEFRDEVGKLTKEDRKDMIPGLEAELQCKIVEPVSTK